MALREEKSSKTSTHESSRQAACEEDAGRDTPAQVTHLEVGDNAPECRALRYRSVKAALPLVLVCAEF